MADLQAHVQLAQRLQANIAKVIVGKPDVIRLALVTLFSRGHLLIEDVPGVGKTMLARAIAKSIQADFKRIQFTPDLLPTDVTGVSIFNQKTQDFSFRQGPVFTAILLADEVNRATPRTQSSLLEAMEERQVSVDGVTHPLSELFFVIATQNPIELSGTYPLPEAQLDRFLLKTKLGYTSPQEEVAILTGQKLHHPIQKLEPACGTAEILALQQAVKAIYVDPAIQEYIVKVVGATRKHEDVVLGASPRGSLALMRAAQALALLDGRDYVVPDAVKKLALAVLGHRIILTPQSKLSGFTSDLVVEAILSSTSVPVEKKPAGATA
jgi:MoxR-like ATPase